MEAELLLKEKQNKEKQIIISKKTGDYYQPAEFAKRLKRKYAEQFGHLNPGTFEQVKELNFRGLHVDEDVFMSIISSVISNHLTYKVVK